MKWFKKSEEKSQEPNTSGRNMRFENTLRKSFGLHLQNGGWQFDGGTVIDDLASALSGPDSCLDVLKTLQKRLSFNQVCVIAGNRVVMAINTTPKPTCIVTGLNADGVAGFISLVIKNTGEQVSEYQGLWLLDITL